MYNLFIQLFNMSVTAGWLILAVLMVRFLSKRMPKTWHCFLWYLVMLRLLLPVSIESEWSLIPNSKVITEELLYSQNPLHEVESINITKQILVSDGQPLTDAEKQAKYEDYLAKVQVDDLTQSITPDSGDSVNPLQIIVYGASCIWLAGMGVMLLYTCISYRGISKRVREAVLLKKNIYQSEYVDSPFVFGLIKPRIYVPFSLQGEALDCVIAHERTHIRRYDHIVRMLAFLLLIIYWFHPLVWVFYLLLCRDMELACDEMVLKQIGMDKKKLYSQILLECSTATKRFSVCPLAFGETSVKQRVKNILNFRKPAVWLVAGTVILCVVLVICFMTNPVNDRYETGVIQTQNEYETSESEVPDHENKFIHEQIQQQLLEQPENIQEVKNLQEPPALYLTDSLSSLYSEFYVQAGTYEWSYQTEEGMIGISACGPHPLEAAEHAKVLNIPHYNGMEDVIYTFAYSVMPDRMEIEEYGSWDMGNAEAELIQEKIIKGESFAAFKQDRIYAIRAVWEESKLEDRGFCGNAYYTIVTGKKEIMEEETVTIIAHAKEIIDKQKGRILISSDTDEYPGAFYLDIADTVYGIDRIKCGERMLIQMKDTKQVEGKLPVYEASFIQVEREVNTLEGVTMQMETYNAAEGDVEICNESGRELTYGDWYEIQVYRDGNWYNMPLIIDNAGFHDIGYPVFDQNTSVWEINWSYFYGELPKGKYRIVKDILDTREPGEFTKYYLTAEFEIGYEHYIVG